MAVFTFNECVGVTFNGTIQTQQINTCDSAGNKVAITGSRDWTAQVVTAATGAPTITRATAGGTFQISFNTGQTLSGPAVCLRVTAQIDVDSGAYISHTYEIGGTGAATWSAGTPTGIKLLAKNIDGITYTTL